VNLNDTTSTAPISTSYLVRPEGDGLPERNTAMNATDPVRRVSVVSTGQVQIHPDHVAANWRPMAWWLLASRSWTGPRPINAYVIEHRDGLVLFDTGQDRASVTDPGYFPRGVAGVLYGRLATFEIDPQETLTSGLDRLGYAAGDVTTAVISHLHQDHIGGLAELSDADIVVSQAEWDTLSHPLPELRGLMRRHIDLPGLRWHRITNSKLVMCPGSAAVAACAKPPPWSTSCGGSIRTW